MTRRALIAGLLTATALVGGLVTEAAWADEKKKRRRVVGDHDDALSAREDGSIQSLADVLAAIEPQIEGEIIETEFGYEDGVPTYEFKYVDRNGRVREVYVDARSGAILLDERD